MASTKSVKSVGGMGISDTKTLKFMFAASPVEDIDVFASHLLLKEGVVVGNTSAGDVDLDYSGKGAAPGAPKIEKFFPDIGSPSSGVDPNSIPPNPSDIDIHSSGFGSTDSPDKSSQVIAQQLPKEHP